MGHYARNGFFYTVDRTNGRFIAAEVRQRSQLDQGHRSGDRQAGRLQPEARRAGLQPGGARAARRSEEAHLPDLARRRRASADGLQPGEEIAYGVGTGAASRRTGAAVGVLSKDGIDNKKSEQRRCSSDLPGSLTAFDAVNHKVLAKAVTEIEIRSGALATAGGVVFTALQDGWVVAYNDETLEELWRFNVGTPLKGAPVTYAIGPKRTSPCRPAAVTCTR